METKVKQKGKRVNIMDECTEDQIRVILKAHEEIGNNWSRISQMLDSEKDEYFVQRWFYSLVRRAITCLNYRRVKAKRKIEFEAFRYACNYLIEVIDSGNVPLKRKNKGNSPYFIRLITSKQVTKEKIENFLILLQNHEERYDLPLKPESLNRSLPSGSLNEVQIKNEEEIPIVKLEGEEQEQEEEEKKNAQTIKIEPSPQNWLSQQFQEMMEAQKKNQGNEYKALIINT